MELQYFLAYSMLQKLIALLTEKGFSCIGPQVQDGTIVYAPINDSNQLPWGFQDQQKPGKYKLTEIENTVAFSWSTALSSIKPFLYKSQEVLWRAQRAADGRVSFSSEIEATPQALIGVRPCDIAAMLIQDRVFVGGEYIDVRYQKRRQMLFTVVINCTHVTDNCFCLAVGYGPQVKSGFDLAMTEIADGLVAQAGSRKGRQMLAEIDLPTATESQLALATAKISQAKDKQKTRMPPLADLQQSLHNESANPQWDRIDKQCSSCGTCTQVCPTCFCHRKTAFPLLAQAGEEHLREWDSCFSQGHSYVHGAANGSGKRNRYRNWLTHKFAYWQRQFDTGGCVGCGRCITWCPKGIDMRESLQAVCSGND